MNKAKQLELLQKEFPHCDNVVYHICTHTQLTGATFCKRAKAIIEKKDTHKLHRSLRVRVTEERYAEVLSIIESEGKFPTVNAWLDWWVWVYVKNHKNESRSPVGAEERQEVGKASPSISTSQDNT